jgi:RNA polymerase-binding transcription factor DksA
MEKRSKKSKTKRVAVPRASSDDILTSTPEAVEVPEKWKRYFNKLMKTRESLLERKADVMEEAQEEAPAFSQHMADAGTDNFNRDLALGMVSNRQETLYEIEQALRRIRDGSYGICEGTGKQIERERLSAIPWTRFSAEQEKRLEKEGGVNRAGLGERENVPKSNSSG